MGGKGWSPETVNTQTTGKIQWGEAREGRKRSELVCLPPLAASRPPLLSHRREASISTMTLASHPGADRHHEHRRRQRPPPLHHRRRRSCQEDAAGSRRAGGGRRGASPGAPEAGTRSGPGSGSRRRAGAGPDRRQQLGRRQRRRRQGLAQSPVSSTRSTRSEQRRREDVQPQPSSRQPLGVFC